MIIDIPTTVKIRYLKIPEANRVNKSRAKPRKHYLAETEFVFWYSPCHWWFCWLDMLLSSQALFETVVFPEMRHNLSSDKIQQHDTLIQNIKSRAGVKTLTIRNISFVFHQMITSSEIITSLTVKILKVLKIQYSGL